MSEIMQLPTLDEELQNWLTEHEAQLIFIAIGPSKGSVTVDNFLTNDGIKLPIGWNLGVIAVKVNNAKRSV